ncbi:acyl-CoA dehydrogenase family protein [Cesiribacter sp. SM1]|uniref:acyl-CoA dehydrogenase family protein n=1 Tax=Cesiribacter sp. SM1 TaxID=2861196 RepID=UPI001CD321E8|nr:acyl-CoA dehydrogenase family protein [Cesiribacter sp. SM1]
MQLDEILKKARHLATEVLSVESALVDKEAVWPKKSIQALLNAGLGGLVAPKETGGQGHGLYALARVAETLGEACASTSLCFGMHCVGTAVIAAKATHWQKENYLVPISRGEHLTTLALSEPGTGAHFYYPQTQLLPLSENEFSIKGKKSFITNGNQADSYVISTVAVDPDADPNLFSCIVVDRETEGLVWGPDWQGMGMRGNSSRGLDIQSAKVSARHLLGKQGDQLWYIFNVVAPYFLTAMAGTYLGIAQAAFNEAREHLQRRSYAHSGAGLSQVHVLQHKLGSLWAKIERTRRLIYYAAQEGDTENFNALPAILSAKAEVAHCAVEAVNEAMTLSGGIAYRENSRFNVLLRDARAAHIMSPTTDLLYTWLGRALLDQPILSD